MSKDWPQDIKDMHTKFGVNSAVRSFDKSKLVEFINFRLNFLEEELNETRTANSAEEFVDGLIDLCVVAIGTLNALDVNPYEAWDKVHRANLDKKVGVKDGRPNPLGLPDLVKPAGWVGPNHRGNTGLLQLFPATTGTEADVGDESPETAGAEDLVVAETAPTDEVISEELIEVENALSREADAAGVISTDGAESVSGTAHPTSVGEGLGS